MQSNVEYINDKFGNKVSIVFDILTCIKQANSAFASSKSSGSSSLAKAVKNRQREIHCNFIANEVARHVVELDLLINYHEDIAGPCLAEYHKCKHKDQSVLLESYERYISEVGSRGIFDKLNQIYNFAEDLNERLVNYHGFESWTAGVGTFIEMCESLNIEKPRQDDFIETTKDEFLESFIDMISFTNSEKGEILKTLSRNIISRLTYKALVDKLKYNFGYIKIYIPVVKVESVCICGERLIVPDEGVEIVCVACGAIKTLVGTAYDRDKNDKYNMANTKNKRYEPKRHCDKRLMQIQAKEDKKIPQEIITKLIEIAKVEYRYGDGVRSMKNMSCTQIRRWLKQKSFTKFNHHAPLIRKLITAEFGEMVSPPQLTPEEEQQILLDFNHAVKCYEDITQTKEYKDKYENARNRTRQRNKPNKFYYWFVLFQIISHVLSDSDRRKNRLLECIHMQSDETIDKDDGIWKMMCDSGGMPKGYVAKRTDRNITARIF